MHLNLFTFLNFTIYTDKCFIVFLCGTHDDSQIFIYMSYFLFNTIVKVAVTLFYKSLDIKLVRIPGPHNGALSYPLDLKLAIGKRY